MLIHDKTLFNLESILWVVLYHDTTCASEEANLSQSFVTESDARNFEKTLRNEETRNVND